MNGREATDAAPIVEALPDVEQYIFCSSAGVYLKSDLMPHREEDDVDPKSRHKARFYPAAMSPLVVTLQTREEYTACLA